MQASVTAIPGNDVSPATQPLSEVPYERSLQAALNGSSLEAYSRDTRMLISPEYFTYSHCFVATVRAAFANHHPLVLSPDMIWLLIAQGFAIHMRENAERFRDRFVHHEGRIRLRIERPEFVPGFAGNDWESVIAELSSQIREHIGEATHRTLVPAFSTTGIVEKAAFEVALLDSMQQYFNYDLMTVCGIPAFLLEGTTEDWQRLRDYAVALEEYDLDWWTPYLLKVLDEFVSASQNKPDLKFWQDFFCEGSCNGDPVACGEKTLKGHIVNFFPYVHDKNRMACSTCC